MARDYLLKGEELWLRFNVKEKEKHAWYYLSVRDLLKEFAGTPQYLEYVLLCEQVFCETAEKNDSGEQDDGRE